MVKKSFNIPVQFDILHRDPYLWTLRGDKTAFRAAVAAAQVANVVKLLAVYFQALYTVPTQAGDLEPLSTGQVSLTILRVMAVQIYKAHYRASEILADMPLPTLPIAIPTVFKEVPNGTFILDKQNIPLPSPAGPDTSVNISSTKPWMPGTVGGRDFNATPQTDPSTFIFHKASTDNAFDVTTVGTVKEVASDAYDSLQVDGLLKLSDLRPSTDVTEAVASTATGFNTILNDMAALPTSISPPAPPPPPSGSGSDSLLSPPLPPSTTVMPPSDMIEKLAKVVITTYHPTVVNSIEQVAEGKSSVQQYKTSMTTTQLNQLISTASVPNSFELPDPQSPDSVEEGVTNGVPLSGGEPSPGGGPKSSPSGITSKQKRTILLGVVISIGVSLLASVAICIYRGSRKTATAVEIQPEVEIQPAPPR
ncbi:hypothetical protein CBR_g37165 [Chara braunii]|uniref:Uncharacterized protein n=1 Tax=Chara braunii TaxID=69332 RepID=A0A388LMK0_CHABU|nr:hypothetical protein CBR_g37165 [Chara braunii]|eukprot:GBG83453.1 hypothetical protein CBR_g37165 [Chara braunii]